MSDNEMLEALETWKSKHMTMDGYPQYSPDDAWEAGCAWQASRTEQSEAKPVAWRIDPPSTFKNGSSVFTENGDNAEKWRLLAGSDVHPLYAAPVKSAESGKDAKDAERYRKLRRGCDEFRVYSTQTRAPLDWQEVEAILDATMGGETK